MPGPPWNYLWDPEKIGARTLLPPIITNWIELEKYSPGVGKTLMSPWSRRRIVSSFSENHARRQRRQGYGIEVARLAGLPKALLDRPGAILPDLGERKKKTYHGGSPRKDRSFLQLPLFQPTEDEISKELRSLKLMRSLPRRALELPLQLAGERADPAEEKEA